MGRHQHRDDILRAESALAERLYAARRRVADKATVSAGYMGPIARGLADDVMAITRTILRDVGRPLLSSCYLPTCLPNCLTD